MPSLAQRACGHPGCRELVSSGRCAQHQQQAAKLQQQRKLTTAERGYDKDFRKLRVPCFERDGWTCVDCGWMPEIVRQCVEVGIELPPAALVLRELADAYNRRERHLHCDHEIPIDVNGELRLELSNLRTRCNECHARKTATEDGGWGNESRRNETNRVTYSPNFGRIQ